MNSDTYNTFTLLFPDKSIERSFSTVLHKKNIIFQVISLSFALLGITMGIISDIHLSSFTLFIPSIVSMSIVLLLLIYRFKKNNKLQLKQYLLALFTVIALITIIVRIQLSKKFIGIDGVNLLTIQIFVAVLMFGIKFYNLIFVSAIFLSALFGLSLFSLPGTEQLNLSEILMITIALIVSMTIAYLNERQKRENFLSDNKLKIYSDVLSGKEQNIKEILDQIPQFIISVSAQGKFLFKNQSFDVFLGLQKGKTYKPEDIFPNKNYRKKIIRLLAGKSHPESFEINFKTKTGKRIVAWEKIKPYKAIIDSPNWFSGKDITEEYGTWKELEKIKLQLEHTQELGRIGTWEWEPKNDKMIWSGQMFKQFGIESTEPGANASKIFSSIIQMFPQGTFEKSLQSIQQQKKKFSFNYPITTNNKERVMQLHGELIYNNKNEIIKVYGTNQDITETKQAEIKLKSIQKSLEKAQKISKLGNIVFNPETNYCYTSKEINSIFGYVKTFDFKFPETLKKHLKESDYNSIIDFIQNTKIYGQPLELELKILSHTKQNKVLSLTAETGKKSNINLILQDITPIRQTMEKLKQSRNKTGEILNSSPNAIIVFNKDLKIQDINPITEEIFGLSKTNPLNLNLKNLFSEQDFQAFTKALKRHVLSGHTIKNIKFSMLRNLEENFPVEMSLASIKDQDNVQFVAIIKDITLQKIFEDNLKEAREKAEEADKLKSAFLANMSHEIRTPMNAIVGFSNMLSEPGVSESERKEFYNYISSNSSILLTLIDDIIDISKIEAGQIKIRLKKVSLNSISEEVKATASEQLKLLQKENIKVKFIIGEELTDKVIETDKNRLLQVLSNLVTNATKFTEKGHIYLKMKLIKEYNKKYIQFEISDTGRGIKQKDINRIFNQFIKLKETENLNHRGTGLGLTLSKKIIGLLGGRIWVESEYKSGTSFYFTLPYLPVKNTTTQKPNSPKIEQPIKWINKKIIIAEDEYTNFKYLETVLSATGAKIVHAQNGEEAINFFQSEPDTDIILMDIRMPKIDGYQATEKIKKMKPDVPIIACTAYAMSEEKQQIMTYAFDDYIAKPIDKDKLLKIIRKFI
ncbi:MAG: ATP-binding protein [Bacteroidota bacterium]|nr:ATP-binding protein [Bacteroidota bacterium]